MGDISYSPLIDQMVWSYTRITTFDSCPYQWYMKYIKHYKEAPQFYSSYGSFIHELIEKYYKGEISKEGMAARFLIDFKNKVQGKRPKPEIVDSYIHAGLDYLRGFKPFPFNMLAVEKKVEFKIGGRPFIGFIDYVGEKDGEIYIIDNKSRKLKPRSNRKTPTVNDKDLDKMLRQMYIYSTAIKDEYGKFPKELCFNCFRNNQFIREPFSIDAYEEAVNWATESIDAIRQSSEFPPQIEFMQCMYLCGLNDECCYWQAR